MFANYQTLSTSKEVWTYSDLLQKADQGKVAKVMFEGNQLSGETVKDDKGHKQYFKVNLPPDTKDLSKYLYDKKVAIESKPPGENIVVLLLTQVLPYVLIIGFFILLFRQAQSAGGSQAFSFGRSRAKQLSDTRGKVTFEDVAGVEEAKEELREVVDFLRSPAKYKALGARIPKGVLLLGEPGTGKTLLGRAVAGEAGVPFYYISGSDFVEMFVGVGASRVRDLFENAKKNAPCIVFVDEIDAVGRQRGAGLGGGHDEREQTLNQLLVEMDGFEVNNGVIVLAATNRPDVLDPALLRPGRFDRQIVVSKPDVKGREAILKVHSRGKPLGADVELEILAKRTPGFTGADLENLLNESALLAARNSQDKIYNKDCEEAIDRVIMGPERKSRIISDKEKRVTAYHEAGHALTAKLVPGADPVRKVTILPRGMALGVTWTMPDQDKHLMTKNEILAEITVLMGGRTAEAQTFAEITTGASNDLKVATDLARKMVTKYGMSKDLGPVTFGKEPTHIFLGRDIVEDRNYSEDVANKIDTEVKQILDGCYEKSRRLLETNKHLLEEIAEVLLDKEVIEAKELDEIIAGTYKRDDIIKAPVDDDEVPDVKTAESKDDKSKGIRPAAKDSDLAFE
ncbi:MAG: ATP-dependent zinc metalloprotease FtsH [Firmicutes bacterium]|nr:ATP-dependent zinc metalloprotease FtsH [Bacillota bacterium]